VLAQDEQRKAIAYQAAVQACWKEVQAVLAKHNARFVYGIVWQQNGMLVPTLSIEVDAE